MDFNFKDFSAIQEELRLTLIDIGWYRERYEVPETKNRAEQDQMLSKWIVSATEQIDSICEGRLSIEIPKFNPKNPQDAKELAIVQSCVGDLVEYFVLTGKAFADVDKNIQSSVPYDLKTKASDGNLEEKRRDILRKLATTRFYRTAASSSASGSSSTTSTICDSSSILIPTSEEFQILVELLQNHFLSNKGKNTQNSNILFGLNPYNTADTLGSERQIIGSSHIKSNAYNQNLPERYYPTIFGYKFNNPVESSKTTERVAFDESYYSIKELVDKYGLAFFGEALNQALTRQEIYNLIQASNTIWNELFEYEKGVVVDFKYTSSENTYLGQAVSLIENNIGNNPADEGQTAWEVLQSIPFDITELVNETAKQVEASLDPIIDEKLDALPTVEYVSEYDSQVLTFNDEADFERFKLETNTTDEDYLDVYNKQKIRFHQGEIKMFNGWADRDSFIAKYRIQIGEDYQEVPGSGFLRHRVNNSARENNGIIDQNYFQRTDLTHNHDSQIYGSSSGSNTGALASTSRGGTRFTTYSKAISVGVTSPKSVDKLLDVTGVWMIYFLREVERDM